MTETSSPADGAVVPPVSDRQSELEALLEEGRPEVAAELLITLHPADQADAIRDIDPETREAIFPHLGSETLAHIIEQLDGRDRGRLVDQIPRQRLARILNHADSDVTADVLRHIDRFDASRVLSAMAPVNAAHVMPLLIHEDESAGGRMTRGYLTLLAEMTTDEAITHLRIEQPNAQEVYYLYVVDDQDRLEGIVNLRELITVSPDTPIGQIMNRDIISVTAETDQEEAARLLRRYDLLSIPVVGEDRRLLGVVTADDLMDVQEEEATEDIYHLAGLQAEASALSPTLTSVRRRIPWLLLNLLTAFLAALTVHAFEDTIARVAILAAFMPIVAGHGGNTGTQAATLVVRGLALGQVSTKDTLRVAGKQVMFTLIHGVLAGVITAGLAFAISGDGELAAVVLVAMVGNIVIAGATGALIPMGMQKIGIDPALASSMWLTTFTDVMGFMLLLGLGATFVA